MPRALADAYEAACKRLGVTVINHCVAQLLQDAPSLSLDLRGNTVPLQQQGHRLNDTDFRALADALIEHRVHVPVLDVGYNSIGDDAVAAIANVASACGVEALLLGSNSLTGAGARALAVALVACPSLRTLDVSHNSISDSGGVAVAALVGAHPGLQWLSLRRADIGIDTIVAMGVALAATRSLQVLDLSDPLLSSRDDDATTHLARALRVNRSLSTLRVAKHRFFDFAAASLLLDCLLDNCVVSHLDLSGNDISGPGATAIARALAAGVPLERIDLAACRVGDEGACALAAAVTAGCALRYLDVRRCEIGDAGVAALAATVGVVRAAPGSDQPPSVDAGGPLGVLLSLKVAGNELRRGRSGTTALAEALQRLREADAAVAWGRATEVDATPFVVDGIAELAVL